MTYKEREIKDKDGSVIEVRLERCATQSELSKVDKRVFKTKYNISGWSLTNFAEYGDDEYLVEPTGYIPIKNQIEAMMFAGSRLDDYRYGEYFGDDEDEDVDVPFSRPADVADAHYEAMRLSERYRLRKADFESKQKAYEEAQKEVPKEAPKEDPKEDPKE